MIKIKLPRKNQFLINNQTQLIFVVFFFELIKQNKNLNRKFNINDLLIHKYGPICY